MSVWGGVSGNGSDKSRGERKVSVNIESKRDRMGVRRDGVEGVYIDRYL